jgi:2-polyprenyl-6-methoxyphenol hydroxylase-like FAD-dependent oxidoreductase
VDANTAVVIAGAGLAACATACALRARGFSVVLLESTRSIAARVRRETPTIEAFPAKTIARFAELGLETALARARPVATSGFENAWESGSPGHLVEGTWVHVEREALARAVRASFVTVPRLPALSAGPGPFQWSVAGVPRSTRVAIDATGRAATWSRPIARRAARVAALFAGPGSKRARSGRLVRTDDGWAYALFHPDRTTVGIVTPSSHGRSLPSDVANALGVADDGTFRKQRSCPAHAQWSREPIVARGDRLFLAVGDAALAHEPIAGLGISFSLASASAAACAVETALGAAESEALDAAVSYYRELVGSARRRHVAQLDVHAGTTPARSAPPQFTRESIIRFTATPALTGVRRADRIVSATCFRASDGELVRWVGGFDLLDLQGMVEAGTRLETLRNRLASRGVASEAAVRFVAWCIARGVLSLGATPAGAATRS